jgi:tetratricopeptide (TPR) repeat protein
MKFYKYSVLWMALFVLTIGLTEVSAQRTGTLSIGLNRIEGRVTDESNNGVYNAYVELYDNFGSLVNRQRTTGQGRFSFRGMQPGRYTVTVKPYGTNLEEESKEIEINNQSSRSDLVMVDFRLREDKRFRDNEPTIVGTVFAQEVPPDAKRLYKSGVDEIKSNPDKALADLEEAVKLFPKYFDALTALGKAHILKGNYAVGYPFLLRAIDINARCGDCYYSLSLAFYRLNEIPAAIKAIDAAATLQSQNPSVRLLQGIIYFLNNDLPGAEKSLLKAKSLFKVPNSEVHWQLSIVYNRQKRNKEAADELEAFLKTKPDIKESEKESVRNLISKLRTSK